MSIRNRELSQFGSFIYIDDATKTVGIATTTTPYVGIGTTNATAKLTVVGDANITGIISATSYYLNGNPLVNPEISTWASSESSVYRLTGNVGIGTSIYTAKLTVTGDISGGQFISTTTTAAPLQVNSTIEVANFNASLLRGGIPGSNINSYDVVTNGGTQTLTNKTLTLPTFGGTGVVFNGSTSGTTRLVASATAGSGTLTLPTTTGTLICSGDTNSVTSAMIADLNITNSDVAVAAGITYSKLSLTNSIVNADIASGAAIAISKLASSTISGVSLGSNLNTLTFGTYLTGSSYNGSSAVTIGVAASTLGSSNLVARNASGDFSAGTISVTNLTASQTVQAQDFNSTSDETLKTNIQTVKNSLDTLQQLRGVTFDWRENNKPSIGVIAQELEKVLPQLVNDGSVKSVNYNGLIGVLIEAVKELSVEVQELRAQLNN